MRTGVVVYDRMQVLSTKLILAHSETREPQEHGHSHKNIGA